jgi:hypothetical protein
MKFPGGNEFCFAIDLMCLVWQSGRSRFRPKIKAERGPPEGQAVSAKS